MIIGIGTDLTEIARIAAILRGSTKDKFLLRILTPAEREVALQRATQHASRFEQFVAGRFAAKEAVAKALGCGIGDPLSFQHIEILHDSLGKPQCSLIPEVLQKLHIPNRARLHVSISHTTTHASAFAVLENVD